jgi:hypothetical protein
MSFINKIISQFHNTFNNIELCNEKVLHNKVSNVNSNENILCYRVIPKGNKRLLWFTNIDNNNYCFSVVYNFKTKQIIDIKKELVCFNQYLTIGKGTLLYGTYIQYKGVQYFSIEDVIHHPIYNKLNTHLWKNKLHYITTLFMKKQICNIDFDNSALNIFVSPFYNINIPLEHVLNNTNYKIYSIQYLLKRNITQNSIQSHSNIISYNMLTYVLNDNDNDKTNYGFNEIVSQYHQTQQSHQTHQPQETQQTQQYANFIIKSHYQEDIYNLYCLDKNKNIIQFNIANIPDYKTSVMMNKYFRNIKENTDLDALEESDDEDNFQNVDVEKHLLNNICIFKCIFCVKTRMWTPVKCVYQLNDEDKDNFNNCLYDNIPITSFISTISTSCSYSNKMRMSKSMSMSLTSNDLDLKYVDTKENIIQKMMNHNKDNINHYKNNKNQNKTKPFLHNRMNETENVYTLTSNTNKHTNNTNKHTNKYNKKSYKVNDVYKKKSHTTYTKK